MFNDPEIGSSITIDGIPYQFSGVPGVSGIIYAEIGRRAKVYRLFNWNRIYALKVFKPKYRNENTTTNTKLIKLFSNVPGLAVANRIVLHPEIYPQLIDEHPEFAYAVFMPWIEGNTWSSFLIGNNPISRNESFELANTFANIMVGIENQILAHCDLSPSNLIFSQNFRHIELVDIEEIFGEGLSKPSIPPSGTRGYTPKWMNEDGLWEAGADRFSFGILIAEIILWQFPEIRDIANNGDSFFVENEFGKETKRFKLSCQYLESIHPELLNIFKEVWYSESIEDCPLIADWKKVIEQLQVPQLDVDHCEINLGVLDLCAQQIISPCSSFRVTNAGTGKLVGHIEPKVPWIDVKPHKFECYGGETKDVVINLGVNAPITKAIKTYHVENIASIKSNAGEVNISGAYSVSARSFKFKSWMKISTIIIVLLIIGGILWKPLSSLIGQFLLSQSPGVKTVVVTVPVYQTLTQRPEFVFVTQIVTQVVTGTSGVISGLTQRTPSPTIIPTAIVIQNARVRSGPGQVYPTVAFLSQGSQVDVLGKNEDSTWYVVKLKDGEIGWISGSLVQLSVSPLELFTVESPPTPIFRPNTPTNTSTTGSRNEKTNNAPITPVPYPYP